MLSTVQQLTNAGSKLMNVNGGTTPKTFSYTASADHEVISSVVCVLKDEGSTGFANFGSLSALANGVLIQVTQSGVTRTVAVIKDNADFCTVFSENQFGNGAVLSILSLATPEGFGDTNNCFVGTMRPPMPIDLRSGDNISVIVQDNLSSIDVFQMSVLALKD